LGWIRKKGIETQRPFPGRGNRLGSGFKESVIGRGQGGTEHEDQDREQRFSTKVSFGGVVQQKKNFLEVARKGLPRNGVRKTEYEKGKKNGPGSYFQERTSLSGLTFEWISGGLPYTLLALKSRKVEQIHEGAHSSVGTGSLL